MRPLARVEEDAGASKEDEGGGAEMRDPAGKEDPGSGATGGEARVDADMIDGHEDHDGSSDYVDRGDPGRRRRSDDCGSGLKSCAHTGSPRACLYMWEASWRDMGPCFDGKGKKR